MYGNDELVKRSFNNDFRNTAFINTGIKIGSDAIILNQFFRIIPLVSVPVTFPAADNS